MTINPLAELKRIENQQEKMKKTTIIVTLLVALCSCGPSKKEIMLEKQRTQIYSEVPTAIHASLCWNALDDALEELNDMASDYVERQVDDAYDSFLDERYGWCSSLYDNMDDLAYYLGGKTEEEKFRDELDAYVDRASSDFDGFVYMAKSSFDSLFYKVGSERLRSEGYNFRWFGSGKVSDVMEYIIQPFESWPEADGHVEIACELVKIVILATDKPVITACEYDKNLDLWTVRFEKHKTKQVEFYLADDGGYNMEFVN